ncbi:hypothetical protein ACMD2_15290 [Ananas comosus]|uniref:CAAX prenyl protease 2/Lysostaphin resistance protein A-like domain-containing protein n=1 Tax=Ananas comosus TaxID=4615 RepID=A0A199UKE2_ANACO|nr:hypothetical protein ACMD2_15290 [Ananas comosus]
MVVLCIHSINGLLGYACLSWPSSLPSLSAGAIILLRTYTKTIMLVVRGLVTATGIALVEELLFRSWLPEEIAVDIGYYQAVVLSGIAFSLIHRSPPSIPGFFLLSLVLSGIKQNAQGKLAAPIGFRAGIMTANYMLQTGGFIIYKPGTPFWLRSTNPLHPFDGAVGLCFSALLAILFFPQKPHQKNASSVS